MFFIEVSVPKGALDPERRRLLMERLGSVDELLLGEPMHPAAERTMRSCYQAVLHEPEVWTVGGGVWSEGTRPATPSGCRSPAAGARRWQST
ncbi:hypothetical protein ACFQXA_05025 [Nocardiopsis composta]